MITINGKDYRTLEEQVKWLTENRGTGGGAKIIEINVGKPDAVVYDSADGALITCEAEVMYDDETSETIDFAYYVPIIPGTNININASGSDDRIVISATGGGGGTYTAGDGIEINNNQVSAKVSNAGYIGFDSANAISLNNAGKNAIAAVPNKLDASQLSGTHDGTNWTEIQIKGVTKSIPSGGGGSSYVFNPGAGIDINTSGNVKTFSVDYTAGDGLKIDGNDQLTVDYTQVQEKLVAGDNITINGNIISATGGGGTSAHLYRHDISFVYEDGGGETVTFSLYHASSTALTFEQIRNSLPTAYSIPATGNNNDGSIYNGVRKDGSDIRADSVCFDEELACFDYGYDIVDANWVLTDTITIVL